MKSKKEFYKRNTLLAVLTTDCKVINKEIYEEVTTVIQVRDKGSLFQPDSNGDGNNWLNFKYILKVEQIGFPYGLDVVCDRNNHQGFWQKQMEG